MKRHRKDIWTASVINAGSCSFQIFRHNKDEVRDWSFLKESLKDCKVQLTITSKTTRRQDGLFPDRTHQNDAVRTIKGNAAMTE
jgi:hypothetical protein